MSGGTRSPRSAGSGSAFRGDFKNLAAGTQIAAGDRVVWKRMEYVAKQAFTVGSYFRSGDWTPVANRMLPVGRRSRVLPFKQDTRILDPAASTAGLGAMMFVQPEQIIRDTNGDLYAATTYTKTDGSTVLGWLRCLAANDPRDGGNWTEVGAITGLPANYDAPCPFRFGTTYYIWAGGKATGLGIRLYKSDAGVNGTYTLVTAGDFIGVGVAAINGPATPTLSAASTGGMLQSGTYAYRVTALTADGETPANAAATVAVTGPNGAVTITWVAPTGETNGFKVYGRVAGQDLLLATIPHGTLSYVDTGIATLTTPIPVTNTTGWRANRVTEPEYFRRRDGTHVLLAMGFDAGTAPGTHEQIGMWTCPATAGAAALELPANWTFVGNILPVGPAGADDEQVVADPTVIEVNGTLWMLYCGGAGAAVASAVVQPQMLASSNDGISWTKRGPLFDSKPLWPAEVPAPPNTTNGLPLLGPNWRGHFFPLGPEYDNDVLWPYGANFGSFGGNVRRVQARMAVIPIEAFSEVPQRTLIPGKTSGAWQRVQSDATDSRLKRTGAGWTIATNVVHNSGTAYFSNAAGERFGFYFDGTGIRVRGQMRNQAGMFNVYLDGVQVATDVDLYQVGDTTGNYWSVLMVEKDDLPAGQHYIEIEVSANKNPASAGNFVFVDCFEYLPSAGAA